MTLPAVLPQGLEDGRVRNLLELSAPDFAIRPIAGRLAQINRFGGALKWPYSVATHSVLVSRLCQLHGFDEVENMRARAFSLSQIRAILADFRYQGLMHDVSESFGVGDLILPIKRECEPYNVIERAIREQLVEPLELSIDESPFIKRMDERAYQLECFFLRGAWPTGTRFDPWGVTGEEFGLADAYLRHEINWRDAAKLFVLEFENTAPETARRWL